MTIRNTDNRGDSLRPRAATLTARDPSARREPGDPLPVTGLRGGQERIDRGAIPGSHPVPRDMLEFRADPAMACHPDYFTKEAEHLVCCAGGSRSVPAALALTERGDTRAWPLAAGFAGGTAAALPAEDAAARSRWQRRS